MALQSLRDPAMNAHHLELFYYVAKHGGISAAVRHIPYGIQQPAVSGQIRQLEEGVRAKLFDRSPFRLTEAGEELFTHVRPFFENLGAVAEELRGDAKPELRIGGAELVLRDHVPTVMRRVRAQHPEMRLSLHSGFQTQVEEWLRAGRIDLAITVAGARPAAKLRRLRLVQIPLVLLVPANSPLRSAEELWARRKIKEPLVGQPAATGIMEGFQRELKRRGVTWPQTVEATSVELITRYVANGEGIGVNLDIASVITHREVRVLPLPGFAPMTMAVLWRGEPSELLREVIEEVRRYAAETFPQWLCGDPLPWNEAEAGEPEGGR